jgi:DNA-binding transcriptional LysR family regulator
MLALPRTHPLATRESIRFAEILAFDLITLLEGTAIHSWAIEAGARVARKPRLVMEATSYESMRKMVQAGLGIAVIPEPNITPYQELFELAAVPLSDSWATMDLQLIFKQPRSDARELTELIDYLGSS